MSETFNPLDHLYCRRLIRIKVNQLMGRYDWNYSDVYDLKQMFYLKLIVAMKKFDPAKGNELAFIKTIVERYTASIVRDRRAAKRYLGKRISLNEPVKSDEDRYMELHNLGSEDQLKLHLAIRNKTQTRLDQMRLDVAAATEQLSPENQSIVDDLMHKSVKQTAHDRGVSRQSIYRAIDQIRSHFERKELNQYLDDPKSEHCRPI